MPEYNFGGRKKGPCTPLTWFQKKPRLLGRGLCKVEDSSAVSA